MTPTRLPAASAEEVAAALRDRFEGVFASLRPLVDAVEERLAGGPGTVGSGELAIEDLAAALLRAPGGVATGAGYVSAHDVLRDRSAWLEWWTVDRPSPTARLRRVEPQTTPDGTPADDYSSMPWMVVPRETGERHVTGPYVDWFCTTEYALTFTVPVSAAGAFGGVVGVDVPVAELEQEVAPLLERVGAPVALVNATGRVVTTVDFGLLTGDLVRDAPFAELWAGAPVDAGYALRRCDGLPLGVLVRR